MGVGATLRGLDHDKNFKPARTWRICILGAFWQPRVGKCRRDLSGQLGGGSPG